MDINHLPKFVVNLERRKDRLDHISKEMAYMDWDFELFKAIDLNNHKGCSLSHSEIVKIAKKRKYEYVMVIEDDCIFMPYAKSLITKINNSNANFSILNLGPTLNVHLNYNEDYPYLLDITNIPNKENNNFGVYATNIIVYHESIYDKVFEIEDKKNLSYFAIDVFIDKFITSTNQSYCPTLPLAVQINNWSDVSGGMYDNFYTQTYNWNLYSPTKIPKEYLNINKVIEIKNNKEHKKYYHEN